MGNWLQQFEKRPALLLIYQTGLTLALYWLASGGSLTIPSQASPVPTANEAPGQMPAESAWQARTENRAGGQVNSNGLLFRR